MEGHLKTFHLEYVKVIVTTIRNVQRAWSVSSGVGKNLYPAATDWGIRGQTTATILIRHPSHQSLRLLPTRRPSPLLPQPSRRSLPHRRSEPIARQLLLLLPTRRRSLPLRQVSRRSPLLHRSMQKNTVTLEPRQPMMVWFNLGSAHAVTSLVQPRMKIYLMLFSNF